MRWQSVQITEWKQLESATALSTPPEVLEILGNLHLPVRLFRGQILDKTGVLQGIEVKQETGKRVVLVTIKSLDKSKKTIRVELGGGIVIQLPLLE